MSVLVLMYHGIERRRGPLFVDPALFREQVAVIAESGLPVLTVAALGDLLVADRLPDLGVALTFDDGFASVVDEAAPVLLERRLPATVFSVAGHLGGRNDWPTNPSGGPRVALASAPELSALAAVGFEIGGHGLEHAPLDRADASTLQREIVEGRRTLENAVGVAVRSFAFPYGTVPTAAGRAVVRAEYAFACATRIGRVAPGTDPWSLDRVDAHYLRSPERLARAVRDRAGTYLAARRAAAIARRRLVRDYSAPTPRR